MENTNDTPDSSSGVCTGDGDVCVPAELAGLGKRPILCELIGIKALLFGLCVFSSLMLTQKRHASFLRLSIKKQTVIGKRLELYRPAERALTDGLCTLMYQGAAKNFCTTACSPYGE